jgi:hypothetical protein
VASEQVSLNPVGPAVAALVPVAADQAQPAAVTAPSEASIPAQASDKAAPASFRRQGFFRQIASTVNKITSSLLESKSRTDVADLVIPDADSVDPSAVVSVRLGMKASRYDPRTLQLRHYVPKELPTTPPEENFSEKVHGWGMMLNDKIGCCTISAAGHEIQQWTANASEQFTPPDSAILKAYKAVSGYNGDPDTDHGAEPGTVLKYWRNTGIAGHTIGAFAAVDPSNSDHIRYALWTFGSVYLGLNLPKSIKGQKVWDVPAGGAVGDGEPGSLGGHAVEIAGYDKEGVSIMTWGRLQRITWEFLSTYGAEAYAIISKDFLDADGKTPNNGFDAATLKADLARVSDAQSRAQRLALRAARLIHDRMSRSQVWPNIESKLRRGLWQMQS